MTDLYARSVLVLALHQEVSGAFLAEPGDDVVIAHAMDVCGERGAAEAFFAWALAHRAVDGLLAWGLQKHLRFAYGSPLRDRLPAHLAATPPELPQATAAGLHEAVRRANRLGLLATESGLDLRGHALFLIAVHALVPPVEGGEDFFFVHQALAQEVRRKRALYGGAFHSGLVAAGGDPAAEVEVRADLKPAAIRIEPTDGGLYKVKVERTASGRSKMPPTTFCSFRKRPSCCSPSLKLCLCSCWPITSPCAGAATWTNRAIWPSR